MNTTAFTTLTDAKPQATSARSASIAVVGADAVSAQPIGGVQDTFGSLMDQIGGLPPSASLNAAVPTAAAPQAATPALVPSAPSSAVALVPSAAPLPVSGQSVPPPNRAMKPTAASGSSAPSATDADADADSKKIVPPPIAPVVFLQPSPPIQTAVQPPPGTLPSGSATSADTALAGVSASNVAEGDVSSIGDAAPPAPADKPVEALIATQATLTPQAIRLNGRSPDEVATATPTPPSADPATSQNQPATGRPISAPVASISTPPTPLLESSVASAQMPLSMPVVPAAAATQSTPKQPGSVAMTSTVRTARTTAEPTATAASIPTLPPVLDSPVSTSSPLPIVVTTASAGAATGLSFLPTTTVAKPVQQVSTPSSPTTQVTQAIVEPVRILMSSTSQTSATASHVTTIQITPGELGRVDVRIERSPDGPAKIQLIAERPETLSRLVHDQSQLQQALDQAGVPQAGRTLDFSLAPTPAPDPGAFPSFTGGPANGGSSSGNEQQRKGGSYANQAFGSANEPTSTTTTHLRSIRNGIDITA